MSSVRNSNGERDDFRAGAAPGDARGRGSVLWQYLFPGSERRRARKAARAGSGTPGGANSASDSAATAADAPGSSSAALRASTVEGRPVQKEPVDSSERRKDAPPPTHGPGYLRARIAASEALAQEGPNPGLETGSSRQGSQRGPGGIRLAAKGTEPGQLAAPTAPPSGQTDRPLVRGPRAGEIGRSTDRRLDSRPLVPRETSGPELSFEPGGSESGGDRGSGLRSPAVEEVRLPASSEPSGRPGLRATLSDEQPAASRPRAPVGGGTTGPAIEPSATPQAGHATGSSPSIQRQAAGNVSETGGPAVEPEKASRSEPEPNEPGSEGVKPR